MKRYRIYPVVKGGFCVWTVRYKTKWWPFWRTEMDYSCIGYGADPEPLTFRHKTDAIDWININGERMSECQKHLKQEPLDVKPGDLKVWRYRR